MPHLGTIATDYAEKGIQIIALNYQESLSIVQGYQDTYPEILFLLDDGSLYAEYVQNNYIPLNYVLNHDLLQTVEYWEEGFNEAQVLATLDAIRSPLVATLTPGGDTYAPGETLTYDLTVQNWTKRDQEAYIVLDAIIPSGYKQRLELVYSRFIDSEVKLFQQSDLIPLDAPVGVYKIRVQVGVPPADLWSSDYFEITVAP